MSNWFEQLVGFTEESPEQVRSHLVLEGTLLKSMANGTSFECGQLSIPTLKELRSEVERGDALGGSLHVEQIVSDAQALHQDPNNASATFQVASQFNLLEMISPRITPEQGVGIYSNDRTQGPACAIACGAGTIYRNYFVPVGNQIGQTANQQIDCIRDLGGALERSPKHIGSRAQKMEDQEVEAEQSTGGCAFWTMSNGYAIPDAVQLTQINSLLLDMSDGELDELRSNLRVGIQSDTQVTIGDCQHSVTQVYCSALPVAYSNLPRTQWLFFATLVLEAAYEATFCAAILNARRSGNRNLFLTLLGGGAFGNESSWITSALERSIHRFSGYGLNVKIVCFREPHPEIQRLIELVA